MILLEPGTYTYKPVLYLARTVGTAVLVGADPRRIVAEATRLLDDETAYARQASRISPFDDGRAAERIVGAVMSALTERPAVKTLALNRVNAR